MLLSPADRGGAGREQARRPGHDDSWLAAPLADVSSPAPLAREGQMMAEGASVNLRAMAEGALPPSAPAAGLARQSVASGGCFVRPLPLDATCAGAARRFFREALAEVGLPADLVHDGMTMASELAANTLNAHANIEFSKRTRRPVSGVPELWVYVRSVRSGREIVCKIFDSEPGWDAGEPAPVGAAVPAGPDSVRGRGLQMVAGLSAGHWGHHPTRGRLGAWKVPGKAVWFALRVPPASDLATCQRYAPRGRQAIGEVAAALADRGLGAGLVQVNEPGGELAVLSVSPGPTVWCRGDVVWWPEPGGGYDRLHVSDLTEAVERIVWLHEELVAAAGPREPPPAGRPGTLACQSRARRDPSVRQHSTKRAAAGSSLAASASKYSAATDPGHGAGRSSAGRPGSMNRNLRHSWTSALRTANTASSPRPPSALPSSSRAKSSHRS